jgi:hypothetical protein
MFKKITWYLDHSGHGAFLIVQYAPSIFIRKIKRNKSSEFDKTSVAALKMKYVEADRRIFHEVRGPPILVSCLKFLLRPTHSLPCGQLNPDWP